jgi:hypothetical protein
LDRDIGGNGGGDAGNVTLAGVVPSAWSRDEAEWVALQAARERRQPLTVARGETTRRWPGGGESCAAVLYSVFDDVAVGVQDGKVTLSGEVTAGYKAGDLGRIASKVRGVQAVGTTSDAAVSPSTTSSGAIAAARARCSSWPHCRCRRPSTSSGEQPRDPDRAVGSKWSGSRPASWPPGSSGS